MQEKLYGNLRFFRLSWTLDRTAHAILSHFQFYVNYNYGIAIIIMLHKCNAPQHTFIEKYIKKGTHRNRNNFYVYLTILI